MCAPWRKALEEIAAGVNAVAVNWTGADFDRMNNDSYVCDDRARISTSALSCSLDRHRAGIVLQGTRRSMHSPLMCLLDGNYSTCSHEENTHRFHGEKWRPKLKPCVQNGTMATVSCERLSFSSRYDFHESAKMTDMAILSIFLYSVFL